MGSTDGTNVGQLALDGDLGVRMALADHVVGVTARLVSRQLDGTSLHGSRRGR
jgi:hypothetical protein